MRAIKRILTTLLLVFPTVLTVRGEPEDDGSRPFWPQRTADEMVVAPSPEPATLPVWQSPQVDMSTGQGSLSVALLEWQTGGYGMQLGLSYRIGAFRTEEQPGWIGLGWNLTGLGSVSRSICGQPDEKLPVEIRSEEEVDKATDGIEYITSLENLRKDASLDRYSYTLPGGVTGQFTVSGRYITPLTYSDCKIEWIGEEMEKTRDFRVTTPDGTVYDFTEREYSEYTYLPNAIDNLFTPPNYRAVSTWHLSRIIPAAGADTITISYANGQPLGISHERDSETFSMRDDSFGAKEWLTAGLDPGKSVNNTFFPEPKIPTAIRSRTATVDITHGQSERYGTYISAMTLRTPDGKAVKEVTLVRPSTYDNSGLLDSYSIKAADGTLLDGCQFRYHSRTVHSTGDFFGYPNRNASQPYAVTTVIDPETGRLNDRRRYDFTKAVAGALKQTVSASGVTTDYLYEPNSIPYVKPKRRRVGIGNLTPIDTIPGFIIQPGEIDPVTPSEPIDPDTVISIGIRLKSIVSTDRTTGRKIVKEYTYSGGITDIDLTYLNYTDFMAVSGRTWFYMIRFAVIPVYDTSVTLLYGSRSPGVRPESARIYYGHVTETVSGTGIECPLRTDYDFDLTRCRSIFVGGGRDMPYDIEQLDGSENRSLFARRFPDATTTLRITYFGSRSLRGYWRERIGGLPELTTVTTYRHDGTGYRPATTQRYHYTTYDSICRRTGFHSEPLVRRVVHYLTKALMRDYQSIEDLSYFDIETESITRMVDTVVTVSHYSDGSRHESRRSIGYSGRRSRLPSGQGLRPPVELSPDPLSIDLGPVINPDNPLDPDNPPEIDTTNPLWGGDSINAIDAVRLPIREVISEGGHTMERHTLYSSMISEGFFKEASERGLRSLKVAEMWVMDGADTIVRRYSYGRYHGHGGAEMTLPCAITTEINGAVTERLGISGYTPHGRPTGATRTGQPPARYTWGYGGDLLTAIDIGPATTAADSDSDTGEITLHSEYEYLPLTGCTGIVTPSGRTTAYGYTGNRLSRVTDTGGHTIASYIYEVSGYTSFGGRNRILTTTYPAGEADGDGGSTVGQWFDGFGQETVRTNVAAGSYGGDVTSFTCYDALGRQTAAWMPLPTDGDDAVENLLRYPSSLASLASSTYSDTEAVGRTTYHDEPISLPATATIGGTLYAGHPSTSSATCSNPADPLRRVNRLRWEGSSLTIDGTYGAGELSAVMHTDGDGRRSIVFTDCLGATVLTRQVADDGSFADTYTVSDRFGSPLIVIPPEMSRRLDKGGGSTASAATVAELIRQYAFVYSYDRQLRLRSKKLPGCDPVSYSYDTQERLAYTRDGNQARQGRRSFMLYDQLGRVALTGICRDALSDDPWQVGASQQPGMTARRTTTASDPATLCSSGYSAVAGGLGEPLVEAELLTATYYDDYTFIPALLQPTVMRYRPAGANPSPRGLATGSLTAVLSEGEGDGNSSDALLSVTFYDVEDRPLTTVSQSHLGGYTVTETHYTDGGLPLEVKTTIIDADGRETVSTVSYSYDRHGRVIDSHLRYGGYPPLKLTANSYDRLGRLSAIRTAGLLERTMSYDLHGWLTEWTLSGSYFNIGQQLLYADGAEPSYTGRISSKITLHSSPHMTAGATLSKRYDYSYDRLGRLVEARYSGRFGSTPMPDDFSTAYTYDLQGNILTLKRNGLIAPGVYGVVDDLSATFDGNQLLTLTDNASDVLLESSLDLRAGQFGRGSFDYDANGNQTRDLSRNVDEVLYNPLNLPTVVTMADGSTIRYLYTAAGAKLSEIAITADGDTLSRRDYVSNLEITAKGDSLHDRRLLLAEGYITLADTTFHAYIPDYQGNIIAVYNTKTDETEQQTDYYPYGMPHADTEASNPQSNRRKYGAKELMTDHGLNLYDFEARYQNPAFPHFTTPDPHCKDYSTSSIYSYCLNDPIMMVDPNGKDVFLYATSMPADNKYIVATHTFIVVANKDGSVRQYYAYGSEHDGVKGAVSGRLKRRFYQQDKNIIDGKQQDRLKAKIKIEPPDGMSQKEFDNKIIDVAESFGNNPEIEYFLVPYKLTQGNCNTSTSTILLKAGVSKKEVESIRNEIPGLAGGFSSNPSAWTAAEQNEAVEQQEKIDMGKHIIEAVNPVVKLFFSLLEML